MARPKTFGISTSGFATIKSPRAVSVTDSRVGANGMAEMVLGRFYRSNVTLAQAPQPWPTALPEYRLPGRDLVLLQPGPAMMIFWNRVELLPFESDVDDDGEPTDPGVAIPEACYWTYRAEVDVDGAYVGFATATSLYVEQRLRVNALISPGDVIRAGHYVVDFTS